MPEILNFSKIKYENIFEDEYENLLLTGNSKLEFKMQPQAQGGIAVVYAPNGTGKTSFSDVLANETFSEEKNFIADYNGLEIREGDRKFHVIKDQINRNVIPGDTSDYLIGPDIRREYELKRKISNGFIAAFSQLPKTIKDEYKITKIGDFLISKLENEAAVRYIKDIIPTRTRGRNILHSEFIQFINDTAKRVIPDEVDDEKLQFVINDASTSKLVEKITTTILEQIIGNQEINVIEQNDDAIKLLQKYGHINTCVVCDSLEINADDLVATKRENRRRIYESLDIKTKDMLDKVVNDNSLKISDPFGIKDKVLQFIAGGDIEIMRSLQNILNTFITFAADKLLNTLLECFDGTTMIADYATYVQLQDTQPQIDSEELLFIQEVISENIGPEITIMRDEENDNNFKLMLAGQDFLGVDRRNLHLSTGEQNFISLAFELLLARRTDKEFIVMDDPISSFDSVYKNKISFCIVKFLENKKQIIFTHNTDLIRLLEVQQNGCFNLYLFNNTTGGNNGFIRVNDTEKAILINLHKLIKLFQNHENALSNNIRNEKQFLMAMIPFMRGYAHISKEGESVYDELSGVMHGYETANINATEIYMKLFGYCFTTDYIISVRDVLDLNCLEIDVLNGEQYPLLAETLKQTLIYYYLRMKVEKVLVDSFRITINPVHPPMLNQLIRKAFYHSPRDVDAEQKRNYQVFFTSRKTLLNEFNHFEGNMNIFQPAIDIEATALQREIDSIEAKLIQIRDQYGNA